MADARAALIDAAAEPLGAAPGDLVARARFRFPATLPVFAGHFPGAPLVPGVHVIAAVVEAAARALGRSLTLRALERAKWSGPARPDEVLTAEARLVAIAGGWRVDGTVRGPTGVCATCRLLVTADAGAA